MKQIGYAAYYRCQLLWKRPVELILLSVLLPLTLLGIAYLLQPSVNGTAIPIAVVDLDQSDYSQTVLQRVAEQPLVEVVYTDEQEARRLVQTGRVEAAYLIKAGFKQQIQQGQQQQLIQVLHSPASLATGLISERVASETMRLLTNAQAANYVQEAYRKRGMISQGDQEAEWQEIWNQADSYWEPQPLMSISYQEWTQVGDQVSDRVGNRQEPEEEPGSTQDHGQQGTEARQQLLPILGWLSALLMLLTLYWQQWLLEEKQQGIQARLQLSGVSSAVYLVGNILPFFLLILVLAMGSLGLVAWVYGYAFTFSAGLLSLLLGYVFFCLALGVALALWSRSTAQFQGAAFFLVLCTSLFGGSFFPVEEWSAQFSLLSYGTPQGWLLWAVRETLLLGNDWLAPGPALLLFGGLGLCLYLLGWWRWSKG